MVPFTGDVGPTVQLRQKPIDLFSLFFTDELISLLVVETNKYAALCRGNNTWSTTSDEMKAYFGFHVLMGICQLPEIRDYWSRDQRLHYSPISERITRDRFEEITRYLHFVDNSQLPSRGEEGYHRLQKVMPIIEIVKNQCLSVYKPGTQNSIDEAMIPFKGNIVTITIHSIIM